MKPGRKLDAMVAEKVMGRKITWEDSQEDDGKDDCYFVDENGNYSWMNFVPHYSTSISAAWEVVEKLLEYNPFWDEKENLSFELSPTKPKGWMCNFGDDTTREFANTAPHAICLASLKASGVDV